MATELETGLPSIRKIQKTIRDKTDIEIKLLNNELLSGKILWQDPFYLCLEVQDKELLILKQAIAYISSPSSNPPTNQE